MNRMNPAMLMVVTIAATLGFVAFLGGNWAANRGSSCYLDANGRKVCPLTVNHESVAAAPTPAPTVQTVSQPVTLVERKPLQQQVARTLVEKKPRAAVSPSTPQPSTPSCKPNIDCSSNHRWRLFKGSGGGIFHRRWR